MVSGTSTVETTGNTVFTRNLAKYDGGVISRTHSMTLRHHFYGFLEFSAVGLTDRMYPARKLVVQRRANDVATVSSGCLFDSSSALKGKF